MKLLIIGPKSAENIDLVKVAEKAGHQVLLTSLSKISLLVHNSQMKAFWQGEHLKDFDVCLFRGIAPNFAKAKTLARYLNFIGTEVIDRELYNREYEFDKMFMSFSFFQKGLPFIDTFHFSNFKELKRYIEKLPRPVLIKDIQGMHSRNVYSFKTKKDLVEFFSKNTKQVSHFLIQRQIEADFYYRVFVVGNKVLGAMKRMTYFNPKRKKVNLENRSSQGALTPELKELALSASKATNTDIAGVDIIEEKGKYYLLEVNRSPKFKRFSQIMNINVAGEILKFLESINNKT